MDRIKDLSVAELTALVERLSDEEQFQLSLTNRDFNERIATIPYNKVYKVSVNDTLQQDLFFSRREGILGLQFDMDSNNVNHRLFHQRLQKFDRVTTLDFNFTAGLTRDTATILLLNIPIGYGPNRNITINVNEGAFDVFDEAFKRVRFVRNDLILSAPTDVERRPLSFMDQSVFRVFNEREEKIATFIERKAREKQEEEEKVRERETKKREEREKKIRDREAKRQQASERQEARKEQAKRVQKRKRQEVDTNNEETIGERVQKRVKKSIKKREVEIPDGEVIGGRVLRKRK